MNWDVLLLRLPDDVTSVQGIPNDYTPPTLGPQQEVSVAAEWAAGQRGNRWAEPQCQRVACVYSSADRAAPAMDR
jgi:hypothetical protein